MHTIKANAINYPVRTDSEVYQSGDGYERILIVADWDPADTNHLGQVHIRVDKNPGDSFARFSAWTRNSGWQSLVQIPPNDFWRDMPGYLRWANDTSNYKTTRLAGDLIADAVALLDN